MMPAEMQASQIACSIKTVPKELFRKYLRQVTVMRIFNSSLEA